MAAAVLQIAQTRILRLLRRPGVIEDDTVNADDALTDQEPALPELVVASTLGSVPAGPTLRQKDLIRLRTGRDLEHPKGLCAAAHGFSLPPAQTPVQRRHLGLGPIVSFGTARDPPYFKSRVIRRRLGEPAQAAVLEHS